MTRAETNIVLFTITFCWASSYIFVKNIPESISTYAYLTMVCGIASVIMAVVFFRKLRAFNWKALLRGLILAVILCLNLVCERLGVSMIPASTASFIASLSVVFVPLFLLPLRKLPTPNNLAGIALILMGLVVISGLNPAELLTGGSLVMVATCAFGAVYLILVDFFTKKCDPLLLGIGQMFFLTLINFILWLFEEPRTFFAVEYTDTLLASVFMLAFFTKAYAYVMLMHAQKYSTAIDVTVISSTEPVVTMVLALLIPNALGQTEAITTQKLLGSAFILGGAIVSGTSFLKREKLKGRLEA